MLELRNVSVRYGKKKVLREVSLSLNPCRLTVLVGRNGSGKSTMLSCVNQQIPYTGQILEGERDLAGLPARERARTVAILPQSMPSPHITVREMVSFGRNPYLDFTGRLMSVLADGVLVAGMVIKVLPLLKSVKNTQT